MQVQIQGNKGSVSYSFVNIGTGLLAEVLACLLRTVGAGKLLARLVGIN